MISQYSAIAAIIIWLIIFFKDVHLMMKKAFGKYKKKREFCVFDKPRCALGQLELLCRQRNCLDFNGSFPAAAEADEIVECTFKTIQKETYILFLILKVYRFCLL